MALHTEISTIEDPGQRVEVMRLNLEFEDDPVGFRERFQKSQAELLEKVMRAKEILPKVGVPDRLFEVVARMSIALNVDGHRPDIITIKSARTLAALNGSVEVEPKDVLDCAFLALSHRTRNLGMDPPASEDQIREEFQRALDLVAGGRG
jgi:magnesium chelatase subunit I